MRPLLFLFLLAVTVTGVPLPPKCYKNKVTGPSLTTIYAVANDIDPYTNTCQPYFGYTDIYPDWQIAIYNPDSAFVAQMYPWGTGQLMLANNITLNTSVQFISPCPTRILLQQAYCVPNSCYEKECNIQPRSMIILGSVLFFVVLFFLVAFLYASLQI